MSESHEANTTPEPEELAADHILDPADESQEPQERTEDVEQPRTLEQQLAEAEARVLRVQAELENFRKRTQRDQASERQYASLPLARDLLVVIDNLDRALAAAQEADESQGLVEGVKMVSEQILTVLSQHHCEKMEVSQEAFDPNLHEAVGQIPSDEFPAGTIVEVAQPGYRMHDRIVRAPQVLIATPAVAAPEEPESPDEGDEDPLASDE